MQALRKKKADHVEVFVVVCREPMRISERIIHKDQRRSNCCGDATKAAGTRNEARSVAGMAQASLPVPLESHAVHVSLEQPERN